MRIILSVVTLALSLVAGTPSAADQEHPRGKDLKLDLGNGVTLECVWIPPGEFMMGSNNGDGDEKPVHRVTIPQGFWMGKYEVTIRQCARFVEESGPTEGVDWEDEECPLKPSGGGYILSGLEKSASDWNQPMCEISWHGAKAFCAWLSRKTGKTVRLPSEAEWEYACRAGTTTRYYSGNSEDDLGRAGWSGWYDGSNSDEKTHPVGLKEPNRFGLYDMHGNVWEWCEDLFHISYSGAPSDGSAWTGEPDFSIPGWSHRRQMRGGSWDYANFHSRSANRAADPPTYTFTCIGFRVVVEEPESVAEETKACSS